MYNFYVLTNRPSDLVCVSDILSLFPFKSKIDSLIVALDRDLSGGTNGKMVELSPKAPQTESSKSNECTYFALHVRQTVAKFVYITNKFRTASDF